MTWGEQTRFRRAKAMLAVAWLTWWWLPQLVRWVTPEPGRGSDARALHRIAEALPEAIGSVSLLAALLVGVALLRMRSESRAAGGAAAALAALAIALGLVTEPLGALIEPSEVTRAVWRLVGLLRTNLAAGAIAAGAVGIVRGGATPSPPPVQIGVAGLAWGPVLVLTLLSLVDLVVDFDPWFHDVRLWLGRALQLVGLAGLVLALRTPSGDPPEPRAWRSALGALDGLVQWAALRVGVLLLMVLEIGSGQLFESARMEPGKLIATFWLTMLLAVPLTASVARALRSPPEVKAAAPSIVALVFLALRGLVDLFVSLAVSIDAAAGHLSREDIDTFGYVWLIEAGLVLIGLVGVLILAGRIVRASGSEASVRDAWLAWGLRWLSLVGVGCVSWSLTERRVPGALAMLAGALLLAAADLFLLSRLAAARRHAELALDAPTDEEE